MKMQTLHSYRWHLFSLAVLGIMMVLGFDPFAGSVGVALAMAAATPEMLKKITLKDCGAQPNADAVARLEKAWETDKKSAAYDVLDIIGIARKFKPGTSTYGEFIKFTGSFKAINLATKAEYQASVAILPRFLEDQLFSLMSGDGVNDVQFAFRIGVKYDEKGARKYQYTAQPLLKPLDTDPLAVLEKTVGDRKAPAMLPAPKAGK